MGLWVEHRAFVRVRYADTDQMGIMYYGRYFEVFEVARTEMLRELGLPYSEIEALGYELPVLQASAEYHAGARYDDLLRIDVRMPTTLSPRLAIEYKVYRDATDELLAIGATTLGFVQAATGRASRPPKAFADVLLQLETKLRKAAATEQG